MNESPAEPASIELIDDIAVITMDDGKANAISPRMVTSLHAALDRAEADALAVVLTGRPDRFCAGFDLSIMAGDDAEAASSLLHDGAMLCHRLFLHPQPVVVAVTGHALALGSIMLMACDLRYGVDGPYKIGMNEVSIGMAVPRFAVALARERLSRRHLQLATNHARIYDPAGAIDAGFLDQLEPAETLLSEAVATAASLAGTLNAGALRATRETMRGEVARQLVDGLALDVGHRTEAPPPR